MNHRPARVGKLIHHELGILIARELEFKNALVTVTEVIVDKKLDQAKVLVSVVPATKAEEALETLKRAQHELQYQLLKKINIKPMPRINFEIDQGLENYSSIEKILLNEDIPSEE